MEIAVSTARQRSRSRSSKEVVYAVGEQSHPASCSAMEGKETLPAYRLDSSERLVGRSTEQGSTKELD